MYTILCTIRGVRLTLSTDGYAAAVTTCDALAAAHRTIPVELWKADVQTAVFHWSHATKSVKVAV